MAGVISEAEAEYFADHRADELYCGLDLVHNHRDPEMSVDLKTLKRIVREDG